MIQFWSDIDTKDHLWCTDCLLKELKKSRDGTYNEDERVTRDMFEPAGNHGQCDLCLEQCEDYPDCENSEF